MIADQITAQLRKLDVPGHKLDCTKSGTVQWLLDNLRTRNDLRGELYCSCMDQLLALAQSNNWIKKSKIQEVNDHIAFVRGNMSQMLESHGAVEGPKVKTDIDRLKADIKNNAINVRGTLTGRISSSQPNFSNKPGPRTPEAQQIINAFKPR